LYSFKILYVLDGVLLIIGVSVVLEEDVGCPLEGVVGCEVVVENGSNNGVLEYSMYLVCSLPQL
jgi:hypothetical protein